MSSPLKCKLPDSRNLACLVLKVLLDHNSYMLTEQMKEWIFGYFQGWGAHHLTGQPVLCLDGSWLFLSWLPSTSMWPSFIVLICRAPSEQAPSSSPLQPSRDLKTVATCVLFKMNVTISFGFLSCISAILAILLQRALMGHCPSIR